MKSSSRMGSQVEWLVVIVFVSLFLSWDINLQEIHVEDKIQAGHPKKEEIRKYSPELPGVKQSTLQY
jgi:hypothetical protein